MPTEQAATVTQVYDLPELTYGYLPDGAMQCTATTQGSGIQCARRSRVEVNGNPMCRQHMKMIGQVGGLPVPAWPE